MTTGTKKQIETWFKFDSPEDDEPTLEALTFRVGGGFSVEWCHSAVGQVESLQFSTLAQAHDWYATNGFKDYTP